MKFTAKIIDAKFISEDFNKYLSKNEGKIAQVEIIIDKRTGRQNRYLHKVFGIMADHLGYTPAGMKQLLKDEFHFYDEEINKITGEVFRVYKSTRDLSRSDFAKFTEDILMLANGSYQMGILTPEEYYET